MPTQWQQKGQLAAIGEDRMGARYFCRWPRRLFGSVPKLLLLIFYLYLIIYLIKKLKFYHRFCYDLFYYKKNSNTTYNFIYLNKINNKNNSKNSYKQ
jgi:hypothetical protein